MDASRAGRAKAVQCIDECVCVLCNSAQLGDVNKASTVKAKAKAMASSPRPRSRPKQKE